MKHVSLSVVVVCLLAARVPAVASAQDIAGFDSVWADNQDWVDNNHVILVGRNGSVELVQGDTKFNADRVEYFKDTHRLLATGHVQLTQVGSLISADSADFNTETKTGIFYNAWGMASISDRGDRALFGGLEPDMYFEGRTIEKIGPRKYKITKGRFTTCVQPVARWQIFSGSVVISLEHYAVLRNPVIKVKGVPVFYAPIIYYPIKKDDRATGFLLPTYGTSTLRGFTLSNAFFWAISRSQDLTIMHDWFTRTGQGVGADYRYIRTPSARGSLQMYMLNERPTTAEDGSTVAGNRNYQLRGEMNEVFSPRLRLGARVSYFTNLVAQQTYNTNIYDASRGQRSFNVNLAGSRGSYSYSASIDRAEYFQDANDSQMSGAMPRFGFSRNERPIANLPIYLRVGGEVVTIHRGSSTVGGSSSANVTRLDFTPRIRVPFTKLPFLAVNSTISWRGTYWTRSWNPENHAELLDQSVSRRMFDFRTEIVGPTFNRIFNTPNSGYADKLKHTIEPFMSFEYTTKIDAFDQIIQWEGNDGIVGGTTTATYGLSNRLYAKRRQNGVVGASRQILDVAISQSYYTDARASQFDRQYGTAFTGIAPYNFSPITLTARAMPTDTIDATVRAEVDSRYKILRTLSVGGSLGIGRWLRTSATWNITRFISADGLSDPTRLNNFVGTATSLRRPDNRYGTTYSMNYDVHNARFVQQRVVAYYNAQCCGFTFEYQTFNYGTLPGVRVPKDNRFNFSFTLAGIGSFSNFFGALGGIR